VHALWCHICLLWCFGGPRGRRRRQVWCSHACLHEVCMHLSGHPAVAPHPPHCVRQAPKSTMVCGGGGGAPVMTGEGVWSRSCARVQARGCPAMCYVCNTRTCLRRTTCIGRGRGRGDGVARVPSVQASQRVRCKYARMQGCKHAAGCQGPP